MDHGNCVGLNCNLERAEYTRVNVYALSVKQSGEGLAPS